MKKQLLVFLVMTVLLAPNGALAMKDMKQGSMSGMDMGGEMIMLQDQEVDGVVGAAHLMDVKEIMAEHGMQMTHHIMVGFMTDAKEAISKGQVAIKVKSPDGEVSKASKMMGMSGAFGVDITLDQKGAYQFLIGTKLTDGRKRTFTFDYDN